MDLAKLKEFLQQSNCSLEDIKNICNLYVNGELEYSFIRQIYAKLGLVTKSENEYYQIFRYLNSNFDLGCNTLEICGGHYPVLAEYIDKKQMKISKGSITVYDPNLIIKDSGNIKLIKDKFTKTVDISTFDLVIAKLPEREVFDDIIDAAVVNNKDYFVVLSSCMYSSFISNVDPVDLYFNDDYDPVLDMICSQLMNKESQYGNSNIEIITRNLKGNVKCVYRKKF